jgi:hypothetical protein
MRKPLNRRAMIDITSIIIRNCLLRFSRSEPWLTSPRAWIPIEQEAIDSTEIATTKMSVTTDIYYHLENVILTLMYMRSRRRIILNTIHIIK